MPDDITGDEIVYPICNPCKQGAHDSCRDILSTPQGGTIACGCTYPGCSPAGLVS